MEYPCYGLYLSDSPASCDLLLSNAQLVLSFLTTDLGYDPSDILLFGRSIGSGPATFLAAQEPRIGALILMSAFTSLKDAVRSLIGKIPAMIVKDRFINRQNI